MDDLMSFVFYCLDTLGILVQLRMMPLRDGFFGELGSYADKALASGLVTIPGLKKAWDWMGVLVQGICKRTVGYPMVDHEWPEFRREDMV